MAVILIYTALFTPFTIAFEKNEKGEVRTYMDLAADFVFVIDIFVNFFSAYFDTEDNLVVSKKKIAKNYLSGWFWIDFLSVIPFELFFPESKYNSLAKLIKVARLYRLLKLTKLMRILKILREKNKLLRIMTELLRIGIGVERLFIAIVSVILFCHLGACLWYLISEMTDDPNSWVA